MTITLSQAIRNAIEAEHAAEQFYRDLAAAVSDASARELLLQVAAEEREHAAGLELVGRQLVAGELPVRADAAVRNIESAPGLVGAKDLSVEEAMSLASSCTGEASAFFERVAKMEEHHAERIRAALQR